MSANVGAPIHGADISAIYLVGEVIAGWQSPQANVVEREIGQLKAIDGVEGKPDGVAALRVFLPVAIRVKGERVVAEREADRAAPVR